MLCYAKSFQFQSDSFVTLWIVACWAPLSMGFSRQEYWSGLPYPPPGVFLTQGSSPCLLCPQHWQCRFFTISATWEAVEWSWSLYILQLVPSPPPTHSHPPAGGSISWSEQGSLALYQ